MAADGSILALNTLSGRLSRLPPNSDEGANARTDASVSIERLLLLFDEDAKVSMEALSVRRLFAVAVLYVAGWPPLAAGARCAGRAFGGGDVGNWWENCTVCVLVPVVVGAVGPTAEWIVVRVVVKDLTEGAGEEKVLSAPRVEFIPPAVAVVASPEEGACEGAASERAVSGSVDIVGAVDLLPMVGVGWSSCEDRAESRVWFNEGVLMETPVGPVEKEPCPFPFGIEVCPFTIPDSGYGLFFFRFAWRFEFDFIW
jgi:uncharacterized membrane protein YhdT